MNRVIRAGSLILVGVLLTLSVSCAGSSMNMTPQELVSATDYKQFVPIEPVPSPTVTYTKADGTEVTEAWSALSNATIRTLLPNQESDMTTYKLDAQGEIKYLTASTSAEAGVYRVVMDYIQYTTENIYDNSTLMAIGHVGVGLRITAEITTIKANVDLGSLFALGVAAKLRVASGKLSVAALGISSPEITTLFPMPAEIDDTSIQNALEAIAAIKSKIGDEATSLTPELISVKVVDPALFGNSTLNTNLP